MEIFDFDKHWVDFCDGKIIIEFKDKKLIDEFLYICSKVLCCELKSTINEKNNSILYYTDIQNARKVIEFKGFHNKAIEKTIPTNFNSDNYLNICVKTFEAYSNDSGYNSLENILRKASDEIEKSINDFIKENDIDDSNILSLDIKHSIEDDCCCTMTAVLSYKN